MPTFDLERGLQREGFSLVAGVDEAGRGPLAGPVMAAAVILPQGFISSDECAHLSWLSLVDDSKKLTPLQRKRALRHIQRQAIAIGVGAAEAAEIDSRGIAEATRRAMSRAIDALPLGPSYLLIDFVQLPECGIPFHAMAHGDSLCYSIAAASIVAKVTRDRLMMEADALYPGYGFSRHKGYGTRYHLRQLSLKGPSPIHRRSFRPLRTWEDSRDGRVLHLDGGLPGAWPTLKGTR